MAPSRDLFYYTCKACRKQITHKMAISLIVDRNAWKKTVTQESCSIDTPDSDLTPEKSHMYETLRERFQQQLAGPSTVWLLKQREAFLNESIQRVHNILNKGGVACPYCKMKGCWLCNR
ncbi:hypothetical protein X943_002119 [Babesia divergens]|uniref:Uncharacterized protein n=1 Tax=Babesia divergens TaxID=32595 RepID=A0AAD9G780_BABDI|nr:hypothetical protein X943_002119 [Babesia divergens]